MTATLSWVWLALGGLQQHDDSYVVARTNVDSYLVSLYTAPHRDEPRTDCLPPRSAAAWPVGWQAWAGLVGTVYQMHVDQPSGPRGLFSCVTT